MPQLAAQPEGSIPAALARAKAHRATAHYQQSQILTVTPGRLVILLYDGAQRFLRRALLALDNGEVEVAHHAICRTQEIIAELDATLDDRAGAISTNLHRIYDYLLRQLIDANTTKKAAIVDEVLQYVASLAEAWHTAVADVEGTGSSGLADGVQVYVERS